MKVRSESLGGTTGLGCIAASVILFFVERPLLLVSCGADGLTRGVFFQSFDLISGLDDTAEVEGRSEGISGEDGAENSDVGELSEATYSDSRAFKTCCVL